MSEAMAVVVQQQSASTDEALGQVASLQVGSCLEWLSIRALLL